jgi:hypothetical protein
LTSNLQSSSASASRVVCYHAWLIAFILENRIFYTHNSEYKKLLKTKKHSCATLEKYALKKNPEM